MIDGAKLAIRIGRRFHWAPDFDTVLWHEMKFDEIWIKYELKVRFFSFLLMWLIT